MKKRIQVSLDPELVFTAKQVMAHRKFGDNFSGFLEALIREEWERRQLAAEPAQFPANDPAPAFAGSREEIKAPASAKNKAARR